MKRIAERNKQMQSPYGRKKNSLYSRNSKKTSAGEDRRMPGNAIQI
jgi:hypothetical protein